MKKDMLILSCVLWVGSSPKNLLIRSHIMKERMATIWQPGRRVAIKEIEKGIFLFQFFHKLDMQRVMSGGPWSFDGHLLLLSLIGETEMPAQVPLFHAVFWIQVHDLPISFMSLDIGKGLTNYIGEFVEYDSKNNSSFWRTYMRIRVRVNVCKPLKRGKKISKGGGEIMMARFKYE